jgi:ribonuclease HI
MAKLIVPGSEIVVQPRHPHIPLLPQFSTKEIDEILKGPPIVQGLVLYTDGGCKPSRGSGGWGLHGYMFSSAAPKKGTGNQDHILTAEGYVTKVVANTFVSNGEPLLQITPIHYIDGWGSFPGEVTNNIAELTSTTRALLHALEYDVTSVQILTDSEYVQKNLTTGQVDRWEKAGWIKADQQPVANVEYWKELLAARDTLNGRGIKIRFDWVRGHNDNLGNTIADNYASYGVILSKKGIQEQQIKVTTADGYWKYDTEKNAMLANRRCYFNTLAAYNEPGFYYMGDHGKEDDLLGKRMSDGAFSVVKLATPDPAIELVRNFQIKNANERDTIVMLRLDQVFKAQTHKELTEWGENVLNYPKLFRLDLFGMDPLEPLARELNPPRLAVRAVESLSQLADILDLYLAGDPSIVSTDLTSILYETTLKTKKIKGGGEEIEAIQTLKSEYNVGFASLPTEALYGVGQDTKSAKVTLTLGIDLLDRNALKRLEGLKPQVKIVSWLESPTSFRYATVVEAGEDKGIWAGVYSNLRIVS